MMYTTDIIRAEPWEFGYPRTEPKPRNIRAELARERRLREFVQQNNVIRRNGWMRLATPSEIAKLAREGGESVKPLEIEFIAARAGITIAWDARR